MDAAERAEQLRHGLPQALIMRFYQGLAGLKARWPGVPWRSAAIELRFEASGVTYWYCHGSRREPVGEREARESNLPCELLVPEPAVLWRDLPLPPIPMSQLSDVLGHEVSRHTPFQSDKVTIAWQWLPRDTSGPNAIRLWVTTNHYLQQCLAESSVDPAHVRQIDVLRQSGGRVGIDLRPKALQSSSWRRQGLRLGIAGICAVSVLAWSLWAIRDNREADVAEWRARVAQREAEVRPIRQLQTALARSARLQARMRQLDRLQPKRNTLLAELTRCLPPDTVLDRLAIRGGIVYLDGTSRSPEAIVPALSCAPHIVSPALSGTLQGADGRGRQRFSLQAGLRGDGT